MILYHGSNVEVKNPKIIISEQGKDFGFAFYLTRFKEQAESMSRRKRRFSKLKKSIVSVFEWDENIKDLNYINYKNADKEWLAMVVNCRTDINYRHGFDIVEGKVADDTVGETILFLIDKIITKEEAIEKLEYKVKNSQIAFCTEKALKHLKFIESYEVE